MQATKNHSGDKKQIKNMLINVSINDCDAEVWHTPGSPAKFELM